MNRIDTMHPEKDDCIDGSSTSRDAQPKTNRYVSDLFSQEKSQLHDSPGFKPGSIKTDVDHPFLIDFSQRTATKLRIQMKIRDF